MMQAQCQVSMELSRWRVEGPGSGSSWRVYQVRGASQLEEESYIVSERINADCPAGFASAHLVDQSLLYAQSGLSELARVQKFCKNASK